MCDSVLLLCFECIIWWDEMWSNISNSTNWCMTQMENNEQKVSSDQFSWNLSYQSIIIQIMKSHTHFINSIDCINRLLLDLTNVQTFKKSRAKTFTDHQGGQAICYSKNRSHFFIAQHKIQTWYYYINIVIIQFERYSYNGRSIDWKSNEFHAYFSFQQVFDAIFWWFNSNGTAF